MERLVKAILLLNAGDTIASWQYEALKAATENGLEIIQVARCIDDRRRRLRAKYFGYYAFALASRRAMSTLKPTNIRPLLMPGVHEVFFSSEWEEGWQRIPASVADGFCSADVVIKFGLNLLRNPDSLPVKYGVIAYHHGDPAQFRGRPAGFYELKQDAEVLGVIVQRLSDTLDGGEILAKAYAPVVPHSYAQTLQGSYLAGTPLLEKAIEALKIDRSQTPKSLGPNYRLPTNASVARLAVAIARRKASHLAYGLLREKRWQVGWLTASLDLEGEVRLSSADMEPIACPEGYSFVADPFVSPTGGVYCEALNSRSGKGEIARWKAGEWDFLDLDLGGGHASYPQPIEEDGSVFLLPEIASVSSPTLFRLRPDGVGVSERVEMDGLDGLRLLDATLFSHEGAWYLFAGMRDSVRFRLELWVAPALTGPYRLHPSSPVCLDPRGARMAGPIAKIGDRLYRFGQDGTQNYGGRVSMHRIEVLTEEKYGESHCGTIQCSDSFGPHTVSIRDKEICIDFFTEKTTPLAGIRRFKGRYLSAR